MSSVKPFRGSLETMPLPNILQWLSDSKKTGILAIKIRDEEKNIYIQDGSIFSASSNLEKDRFGIIIIKKGYVTQEQVNELLADGRKTGKLLGKQCVEKGLIPEEDVKQILQNQTMSIIESLLHREEGTFEFKSDENDMGTMDQIPLSIALQELFFASAGTREEWKRVYRMLGSLEAVPESSETQPGNVNSLSELQQLIVSRCDGKKRILDLFAEVDRSDFEICKVLADLVEQKWVIIRGVDEIENSEYRERIWQVHIMIEQGKYLRASLFIDEIFGMFPERSDDLIPFREKVRNEIQTDIDRLLSDDSIVLYHKAGFDQTKITGKTFGPEEWFLLSRIDGNTTLHDLCLMTGKKKEKTKFVVYTLIDSGAIDIKGMENETRRKKPEIPDQHVKKFKKPRPVKKPGKKNPVQTEIDAGIRVEKTPMEIIELDRIYKRYLKQNHYQILNVTSDSPQVQIRSEFVRLSRLYHPDMYDRDQMDPDVQERLEELFSMVNHAYRVISNINSKEKYDKNLWASGRFYTSPVEENIVDRVAQIDKIILKPRHDKPNSVKSGGRPVKLGATAKHKKVTQDNLNKTNDEPVLVSPTSAPAKEISKEKQYLENGIEQFKDSKYKAAMESLENVLKHNSRNSDAYYYMSRCQQRMGGKNLSKALDNIKRALILDKENPKFFCQMARVLLARKEHDSAEKYLKTALAWDRDSQEAKYLLEKLKESKQTGFFSKFKRKKF